MNEDNSAIRWGAGLVLLVAIFGVYKTALFPFVALFAFDTPGTESRWWSWVTTTGLIFAPVLAVISGMLAVWTMFTGSLRILLFAVLVVLPPVAVAILFNG